MLNKILSTVLLVALVATMVIGVGCAALSDYVTPAIIDQRAVERAVDAGLAEPNDYAGYANLYKARRLQLHVRAAHAINMLGLEQLMEKEQLDSNILRGVVERSVSEAVALEAAIFDPTTGLLAAGLGVFGLSAGGLLGLFRKRPGDWEPAEVETALAGVGVEVGVKEKQFTEVVKGVQQFMDSSKKSGKPNLLLAIEQLKTFLRAQSTDTAAAVTAAKNA